MKKIICLILVFLFINNICHADWWDSDESIVQDIGSVFIEGEFLDGDIVKLTVNTQDFLTPVLGIAFHLKYEIEKLNFFSYAFATSSKA